MENIVGSLENFQPNSTFIVNEMNKHVNMTCDRICRWNLLFYDIFSTLDYQ